MELSVNDTSDGSGGVADVDNDCVDDDDGTEACTTLEV
jgi:hypothetical protein